MNAHAERFNRTIQEEFVDYHASLLLDTEAFNRRPEVQKWVALYTPLHIF